MGLRISSASSMSWRRPCGLVFPASGRWRWLADRHVLASIAAALPVWLVLGSAMDGGTAVLATWSAWISLVLVQPIAEELVFRGVMQGQLLRLGGSRRIGPLSLANLATTACFVALHLIAQPPTWALATAAPSLVLGHLRERTASVLPAMLVHAIYNAGFGLASLLAWP